MIFSKVVWVGGPQALALSLAAAALAATLLILVGAAKPAGAAFPGSNGDIAYNQDNQIFRMSADGFSSQYPLTDIGLINRDADWSSNGKKIAYSSGGDTGEVYWMNSDGSKETNLTTHAAGDTYPSFFPDYHKIAFTSERSGNKDIYVMTVDNQGVLVGTPIRMTTSASDDYRPAVSPNGKKIAFVSDRSGNGDVYMMNADIRESTRNVPVRLTRHSSSDDAPDWSPDGKKMAFSSLRSGNSDIWVMKPVPEGSTSQPVNLTKNPAVDDDPAFSPDGKKMVFSSLREDNNSANGADWEVFKMRADGTRHTNVTNNSDIEDLYPSWQPDP